MPQRKGLLSPQNTFLDTIATRFDGTHSNFVLGNAQTPDRPIVYCSDGFCELTGFARAQVMSKSCACRFLWGPDTKEEEKEKIENSLEEKKELKSEVTFYKKSKSTFICLLDIVPIKNEKREVVLFLASHKDITKKKQESQENQDTDESHLDDGNCVKSVSQDIQSDDEASTSSDNSDKEDAERSTTYKYERRRSRAVLYTLSGQFDSKVKNKSTFSQLNKIQNLSGRNALPEYKVQEVKKSKCLLLHYGLIKIAWDWLILLCTFYIAIIVPYNAAVTWKQERFSGSEKELLVLDLIVEIIFIADIIINFRTTFVNKCGQIIYSQRMISLNYIKSWFLMDLLAAIPFDLVIMISNAIRSEETIKMEAFNLMKLARMLRLAKLFQKIDRYAQYSSLLLSLLMSMFGLCAHWFACIWLAIGRMELDNPGTRYTNWISQLSDDIKIPFSVNKTENNTDVIVGGPGITSKYLTALYFTCSSLTGIGFGNVNANTDNEKIFTVCIMLVGALMHAVVFGNVTAIIQRMYARRYAYTAKTQELKDFTRTHHVPKHLKQRMQEFFQAMWAMNHGINSNEIMKDFPEDLKGEIALHLNKEILSLSIFEPASQGCLKAIAQQIETVFSRPGEFLVHQGDMLKYIYFVVNGSLEILKDNMVVAILGKGDLFGTDIKQEDQLMRSCCDVRSLAYCDLQCIELKRLVTLLQQYPDYHDKFSEDLMNELTYNMREGADLEEETEFNESGTLLPAVTLPSIQEDQEDKQIEENQPNPHERARSMWSNVAKHRVRLIQPQVQQAAAHAGRYITNKMAQTVRRNSLELNKKDKNKTSSDEDSDSIKSKPKCQKKVKIKRSGSEPSNYVNSPNYYRCSHRSDIDSMGKDLHKLQKSVQNLEKQLSSLIQIIHMSVPKENDKNPVKMNQLLNSQNNNEDPDPINEESNGNARYDSDSLSSLSEDTLLIKQARRILPVNSVEVPHASAESTSEDDSSDEYAHRNPLLPYR